jgi:hypothetical protein
MQIEMNATEKDIFGVLLNYAAQDMSNNGCNEYPVKVMEENVNELISFIDDFSDIGDCDHDMKQHLLDQLKIGRNVYFQDWMLLYYLRKRIYLS